MKTILFIIAVSLYSCKPVAKTMYVQPMVKTMNGFEKVGKPYPHIVLLGDTVKVIFAKF